MKILCATIVLLGFCATLNNAGMYHYNKQPEGPPPSHPQYLPNYDVPSYQDYETVKHHSWGNQPWKPITNFPWPGPEHGHELHYPPHYHHGPTVPCKHKVHTTKHFTTTTTTHKPTTTTTTTTHRPVETKKPHLLLEKLGNTHKQTTY
ncbi:uncharacterized protein LOC126565571 [Anopheles maculipalpis]|uniref:uncharacterized protein LOC126565571 n=1 Tax=Anopheles maculipalpis TaxID=1496333 RepID=UPI002158FD12|nr:uncharacterized protein LOC126565571 [Anopheles maculipalpis]